MLTPKIAKLLLLLLTACHTEVGTRVKITSYPSSCDITETAIPCVKYVKAYDGDTITVELGDRVPAVFNKWDVRIRGVDTPEIKGNSACEKSLAKVARRLVDYKLQKAQRIDLINVGQDKYYRLLSDVMVDGESLSSFLISQKIAAAYDGGTKSKFHCPTNLPAEITAMMKEER